MPAPHARVEQRLRTKHVGHDELGGAVDRSVDVRLGGEVDHDVVTRYRVGDLHRIADVALHESVARAVGDWRQVLEVAGVRQLVEHRDLGVLEPG